MTKAEIEKQMRQVTKLISIEKEMLTPAEVAPVLGCNPYAINVMAKQSPERLGFPVCMIGNRVKIPRRAFLAWLGHGEVSE